MSAQLRLTSLVLMVCLVSISWAESTPRADRQSVLMFTDGRLHEVPFTRRMTLTKALLAIGGYSEFSQKAISLERNKTARRVDLRAITDGRAPDITLEPWDIITIGLPPHP